MVPVPPLKLVPLVTTYVPLNVWADPSTVGHTSPEMSIESVFIPVVLEINPKPPAPKQEPAVDIGSPPTALLPGVVSTLSSKVNDPPLNLLPKNCL